MGKIKDFIIKNQKKLIISSLSVLLASATIVEAIFLTKAYWAGNEQSQAIVVEPVNPTKDDFTFYAAIPNVANDQGYDYYGLDSIPYDLVDSIEGFAVARYEGFSETAYIPESPELKITFVDEQGNTDYRWYNYDVDKIKSQKGYSSEKLYSVPVTQILGGYYNTYDTLGSNGFNSTSIVKHVVIPRTVNIVYEGAFQAMEHLEKVTILGTTNYNRTYSVKDNENKLLTKIELYSSSTFEGDPFDTLNLTTGNGIYYYISDYDHSYYGISTMTVNGQEKSVIEYTSMGKELYVKEGTATYVSGSTNYCDQIYFEDGAFITSNGTKITKTQIANTQGTSSIIDFDGKSVEFVWQDNNSHNGEKDRVAYSFNKADGTSASLLFDQYNGYFKFNGGIQNPGEANPSYYYTTIVPSEDVASITIGDQTLTAQLLANNKYTLRTIKNSANLWELTVIRYNYEIRYTSGDGRTVQEELTLNANETNYEEYTYNLGVSNYPTLKMYEKETINDVSTYKELTHFDVGYLNASYAAENHKYLVTFSPCHIYNSIHYYNESVNGIDYLMDVRTQSRLGVERIYYLNEVVSVEKDKIEITFDVPEYWDESTLTNVYIKGYSRYDKTKDIIYFDGKSNPTTTFEFGDNNKMTKVGGQYKFTFFLDYGSPMFISFYREVDGTIIQNEDVPWSTTGGQSTDNTITYNDEEINYAYESESVSNASVKSSTSSTVYTVDTIDDHTIYGSTNQYVYIDVYQGQSSVQTIWGTYTPNGIISSSDITESVETYRYNTSSYYLKVLFYDSNKYLVETVVVDHSNVVDDIDDDQYNSGQKYKLYYVPFEDNYRYLRVEWYKVDDDSLIGGTGSTSTNPYLDVELNAIYQGKSTVTRFLTYKTNTTTFSKISRLYSNGLDSNKIYVNAGYITKNNHSLLYISQSTSETPSTTVTPFQELKTYYWSNGGAATAVTFNNGNEFYKYLDDNAGRTLYIDSGFKYPVKDYYIYATKISGLQSFKIFAVSNYSIATTKEKLSIAQSYEFKRNNANSSFEEYYYDGAVNPNDEATYLISSYLNDAEAGDYGISNSYGTTQAESSLGSFNITNDNPLLLFTPNENSNYQEVVYNVIDESGKVVATLAFNKQQTSSNGYQTFTGTIPFKGHEDSYFTIQSTGSNPTVIGYFLLSSNGNYKYVSSTENRVLTSGAQGYNSSAASDTTLDLSTSDEIYTTASDASENASVNREYDYYLTGSFNNWKTSNEYGLVSDSNPTIITSHSGTNLYYTIKGVYLEANQYYLFSTGDTLFIPQNDNGTSSDIITTEGEGNSLKYKVKKTGYYNVTLIRNTTSSSGFIGMGATSSYTFFTSISVCNDLKENSDLKIYEEKISMYFNDAGEWYKSGNPITYELFHKEGNTYTSLGTGTTTNKMTKTVEGAQKEVTITVNGTSDWYKLDYQFGYGDSNIANAIQFTCGTYKTIKIDFEISENAKLTGCLFFTADLVNKNIATSDSGEYLYNNGTEYLYSIRTNKNWSNSYKGMLYDVTNDTFFAEDVQLNVGQEVLIYDYLGNSTTINQDYSWDYKNNASQALIVGAEGSYLITLKAEAYSKTGKLVEFTAPYTDTIKNGSTAFSGSLVIVKDSNGIISKTYNLISTNNRTQFYADVVLADGYTVTVSHNKRVYQFNGISGLTQGERAYRLYFSTITGMNSTSHEFHPNVSPWQASQFDITAKEFLNITFSPAAIFDGSYLNIDYSDLNITYNLAEGGVYPILYKEQQESYYLVDEDGKSYSMLWVNDFGGGKEGDYSVYTTTVTTSKNNATFTIKNKNGEVVQDDVVIKFSGTYVMYYCGSEIYYNHSASESGQLSHVNAVRVQGETNYYLYISNKTVYDSLTNSYNNAYEEYALNSTFVVSHDINLTSSPINVKDANENVLCSVNEVTLYDFTEVVSHDDATKTYYYYDEDNKEYVEKDSNAAFDSKVTYYTRTISKVSTIPSGVFKLDYSIDNRRRVDDTYFVFTNVKITRLPATSISLFYYQSEIYQGDETYYATDVFVKQEVTAENFNSLKDNLVEFKLADKIVSGKTYYVLTGEQDGQPVLQEVKAQTFEQGKKYYIFNQVTSDDSYSADAIYYYYGFSSVTVKESEFNEGEYYYYKETEISDNYNENTTYYKKTPSGQYVPTSVSVIDPNTTYYIMKEFNVKNDVKNPNIQYYQKLNNGEDDVYVEVDLTISEGYYVIGTVGTITTGNRYLDGTNYYLYSVDDDGTEHYNKVDSIYIDDSQNYYKINYFNSTNDGRPIGEKTQTTVSLSSISNSETYFKYVNGHFEKVTVIDLSKSYNTIDEDASIMTNETVLLTDKDTVNANTYYTMDSSKNLTKANELDVVDNTYYKDSTSFNTVNKGSDIQAAYNKNASGYTLASTPTLLANTYYVKDASNVKNTVGSILSSSSNSLLDENSILLTNTNNMVLDDNLYFKYENNGTAGEEVSVIINNDGTIIIPVEFTNGKVTDNNRRYYDQNGNELTLYIYHNLDNATYASTNNYQFANNEYLLYGNNNNSIATYQRQYNYTDTYYKRTGSGSGRDPYSRSLYSGTVYMYATISNAETTSNQIVLTLNNGTINNAGQTALNNLPDDTVLTVTNVNSNNGSAYIGTRSNRTQINNGRIITDKATFTTAVFYTSNNTNYNRYSGTITVQYKSVRIYETSEGKKILTTDKLTDILNKTQITYSDLNSVLGTTDVYIASNLAYKNTSNEYVNYSSVNDVKTKNYYGLTTTNVYNKSTNYYKLSGSTYVQVADGDAMQLNTTYYNVPTLYNNNDSYATIANSATQVLVKNGTSYTYTSAVSLKNNYYVIGTETINTYDPNAASHKDLYEANGTNYRYVSQDKLDTFYVTASKYENNHVYSNTEEYYVLDNNTLTLETAVKLDKEYKYFIETPRATVNGEVYDGNNRYFSKNGNNYVTANVLTNDVFAGKYYLFKTSTGDTEYIGGNGYYYTTLIDGGVTIAGTDYNPAYKEEKFDNEDFSNVIRQGGYYYFTKATTWSNGEQYYAKNKYLSLAGTDGHISLAQFNNSLLDDENNDLNIKYYVKDPSEVTEFDSDIYEAGKYFTDYILTNTYIQAEFAGLVSGTYYELANNTPTTYNPDNIYFVVNDSGLSIKVVDKDTYAQPYKVESGLTHYYYGLYNQYVESGAVVSLELYRNLGGYAPEGMRFDHWTVSYEDAVSENNGRGDVHTAAGVEQYHYDDGETINLGDYSSAIILYPVFKEAKYNISFSRGQGYAIYTSTNGTSWVSAQADELDGALYVRVKVLEGYSLRGIHTGIDGVEAELNGDYYTFTVPETINDDVSVIVSVEANKYNATLNLVEPDGKYGDATATTYTLANGYEEQNIVYGKTHVFPVPTMVDTSVKYVFEGWYLADGTKITDANGKTLAPWSIANNDTTLYAHWRDGFAVHITKTYIYGDSISVEEDEPILKISGDRVEITMEPKLGYEIVDGSFVIVDEDKNPISYGKTMNEYSFIMPDKKDVYIEISYERKIYDIYYYNCEGATFDGETTNPNKTKYTVTDDSFTLVNPSKVGYTFDGWLAADGTLSKVVTISKGSTGSRSFTAKFTAIVYNVSVRVDEGTVNKYPFTVETDGFDVPIPTRNGWTFDYFLNQADNTECTSITISKGTIGDQVYITYWTLIHYDIVLDLDGGVDDGTNAVAYTIIDNDITIINPTKVGYTFDGWKNLDDESEAVTKNLVITSGSYGDKHYKATYTPIPYSISYTLGGGRVPDGSTIVYTYTIEDEIEIFNPTLKGYDFLGWKVNGSEEPVIDYVIEQGTTGNLTLVATWDLHIYQLTYELDGGQLDEGVTNPSTYTLLSEEITLNNPSKVGYTFIGWEDNGGYPYKTTATIRQGSTGDHNYVAKYKANDYYITFNVAGGVEIAKQKVTYDSTYTLPTPIKTGYDFTGWTLDGEAFAMPEEDTIWNIPNDVTLVATWEVHIYKVEIFVPGGIELGGEVIEDATYKFEYNIESENISQDAFIRDGYVFNGWTLVLDNVNKGNIGNTIYIPTGSIGNRVYSTSYTIIPYTLEYELNGGQVSSTNPTGYDIETKTFTLVNPTKRGYDFAGWKLTEDGVTTDAVMTVEISKGTIGDKKYTATWTPIVYNLTYDGNTGVLATNPATYTIETPTFTLVNPTKDYYDFVGWEVTVDGVKQDGTPKTITIETDSIGHRSYKAIWTPTIYNINIDYKGGTVATPNATTYNIESDDIVITNPTRPGYNFAGWTMTQNGETSTVDSLTIETGNHGDITLVANWEIITYYVTYTYVNQDGATLTGVTNPAATSFTVEDPIFFSGLVATKDGYSFKTAEDWLRDGTSVIANTKDIYTDINVTVKMHVVTYKITYVYVNQKGTTLSNVTNPAPTSFSVESPVTFTDYTVSKDGYSFDKKVDWSKGDTLGIYEPITVTATLHVVTYTITYTATSSSGKVLEDFDTNGAPTSYTVESNVDLSGIRVTKDGYTFTKWSLVKTDGKFEHLTIDASMRLDDYNITYKFVNQDGNALTDVIHNGDATYNVETLRTFTNYTVTKAGYTFKGWDLTSTEGKTGAITVTGTLEAIKYDLTYEFVSSTEGIDPLTCDGESELPTYFTVETLITFKDYNDEVGITGYKLKSWSIASTSGLLDDQLVTVTYDPIKYSITYKAVSSSGKDLGTITVTGAPTEYTVEQVKSWSDKEIAINGYEFDSWDLTSTENKHANLVATALMTLQEYSITYKALSSSGKDLGTITITGAPTKYTVEKVESWSSKEYALAGYKFASWTISSTTGKYEPIVAIANMTLVDYNITYVFVNQNNAALTGVTHNGAAKYNVETLRKFDDYTASKDGYTFKSWDTESTEGKVNDITVTGKLEVITYNLTYKFVSTTEGIDPLTCEGLSTLPTTFTVETVRTFADYKDNVGITGYKLKSWSIASTSGLLGNQLVTVTYDPIEYSITYKAKSSSGKDLGEITITGAPTKYTVEKVESWSSKEYALAGYTFASWTISSTENKVGNITAVANMTLEEYSITYKAKSSSGKDLGTIAVTGTPTKYTVEDEEKTWSGKSYALAGYTFASWTISSTKNQVGNIEAIANMTLVNYDIAYVLNGGTVSPANPISYNVESATITLNDASKTGYIFNGWNDEGKGAQIVSGSTGTKVFEAKFTPKTFTINYNENGGDAISNTTVTYDSAYTLTTPTRRGYDFLGWKLGEDNITSTGTWTTDSEENSLTLDAQWKLHEYTITYTLNGGSVTPANKTTYTINDTFTLTNPTRLGYDFTGWSTKFGKVMEITITDSAEDLSFTANWELHNYNVTLDNNETGGVTTVTKVDSFTYTIVDDEITVSNPSRNGYKFKGWKVVGSADSTATTTYKISSGSHEDIDLVAVWEIINYDITYTFVSANDDNITLTNTGTGLPASFNVENNVTFSDYKDNISITGYESPVWSLDSTSGKFEKQAIVVEMTPVQYTISVDLNKGEGSTTPSITGTIPSTYTIEDSAIAINNPTRTGYTFAGWSVNGVGSTKDYSIAAGSTGNVNLVAQWTANEYKISFNANSGTEIDPITVTFDAEYTISAVSERPGYQINGIQLNGADFEDTTGIWTRDDNITLDINWSLIPYTITYEFVNQNSGEVKSSIDRTSLIYTYDVEHHIDFPSIDVEGYEFIGWYLNAQGTGSKITKTDGNYSNLTIYGRYSVIDYDIEYRYYDHFTGSEITDITNIIERNDAPKFYSAENPMDSCDINKIVAINNYVVAYVRNSSTKGTSISDGENVTATIEGLHGATKIVYVFLLPPMEINYVYIDNGGNVIDSNIFTNNSPKTVKYNEGLSRDSLVVPTGEGYTFINYYKNETCIENTDNFYHVQNDGTLSSFTIYAKMARPVKVTYIAVDINTGETIDSELVDLGSLVNEVAYNGTWNSVDAEMGDTEPTASGYVYEGTFKNGTTFTMKTVISSKSNCTEDFTIWVGFSAE